MPLELNGTTGVQGNSGAFVQGTSVASTSGTSIDFTSIPSWVKRVTVNFNQVSTNGSSVLQVQVGAGSVSTSGYLSQSWQSNTQNVSSTSGFVIGNSNLASYTNNGSIVINSLGSNVWVASGIIGRYNGGDCIILGGSISLGGTLDRVRITTINGTDTFDAGSINILYE
jgi:hypothetical protein